MWTRILRTPFWAIYIILPFILYRDLHATPLQIAVATALQPASAILSLYWSAWVNKRRDRLVSNLIWASIIGHLPFVFFPFVNNTWFFVFVYGAYMMLHRGVIPAWMEIMKLNLPHVSRQRVFAYGSAIGYLGDGIFPFIIGGLLDGYFQAWRWLFPLSAFVALIPLILQYRILIRMDNIPSIVTTPPSMRAMLVNPWKNAWKLMINRPDFRRFQVGFMLGGAGLMVMKVVLPSFFMGVLKLSYTELAIALTLCKGIGFAATSQVWARWMNKVDIYRFSSWVTILAFLFPVCLIAAKLHIAWIYIAYLFYGIMQAGSELSWNLSGPIFANHEDSSVYSSVNVVTVGLRGCVAPALGIYVAALTNPITALAMGGLFCLMATWRMSSYSRKSEELLVKG